MSGAHYPDCLLAQDAWAQAPFTANELAESCECLATAHAHIERIEALNAELFALARQYRSDLKFPPADDSRERRIAAIDTVLARGGL